MEVTPSTPSKPTRARSKAKTAEATAKPAAPRKSRSKKSAAQPSQPEATAAAPEARKPTADELRGMIATEAYLIATQRNFAPGGEVEDWLEAERRILART